jgi:hypothetical protein
MDLHIRRKDWPDYVFVPTFLFGCEGSDDIYRYMRFRAAISTGITFAVWRMTQGIYRFDETLYTELIHTKNTGELPADVLVRLPEWCVYVETPGLMLQLADGHEVPIHGAWALIDLNQDHEPTLVITTDTDHCPAAKPVTQVIPLAEGSIEQGILATVNGWLSAGIRSAPDRGYITRTSQWVHPVVNLLLYLCSDADYAGAPPRNPAPVRTRHGFRLFTPNQATTWNVGVRMGAALRAAYAAQRQSEGEQDGTTRTLRPHIRRAHWHGFRSGPRLAPDGEPISPENRPFDLRWLPPIPVNIVDDEELPAVIKPVKEM